MNTKSKWTRRRMKCPEGDRESTLLIEWQSVKDSEVVHSIICDNPELGDMCGWNCHWFCWQEIAKREEQA